MTSITRMSCVLAVLGLLAGCAWLDIDVSVYRGGLPVATRDAFDLVVRIENSNPAYFLEQGSNPRESIIDRLEQAFYADQMRVWVNNMRLQHQNGDSFDEDKALEDAKSRVDSVWSRLEAAAIRELAPLDPAAQRLRGELLNLRPIAKAHAAKTFLDADGASAYHATLAAREEYENRLAEITPKFERLIDSFVSDESDPSSIAAAATEVSPDRKAGIATSDAVDGRVVGSPTFSRYIATIADDYDNWSRYNTNSFTAYGGDAQFVAISKGLIEYRQKSLDFDPGNAVAAASTLTRAGLKLSAALATGRLDSRGGDSPELPGFDPASMEYNEELLVTRVEARRRFLLELADIFEAAGATGARADDIEARLKSATNWFEAQLLIPAEE